MTWFELLRSCAAPFLPPLPWYVHRELVQLIDKAHSARGQRVKLLDVGSRRSPYTIGLPADITLLDMPPSTKEHHRLDLGVQSGFVPRLRRRRSNVVQYLAEDFLANTLEDNEFDVVVSVEVIEHIVDDNSFMRQLARVVKPTGCVYITTPNGDALSRPSPQHVRHYSQKQLVALCSQYFDQVETHYALGISRSFLVGHIGGTAREGRSFGRMVRTVVAAIANAIYKFSSASENTGSVRTAHLIAILAQPKTCPSLGKQAIAVTQKDRVE